MLRPLARIRFQLVIGQLSNPYLVACKSLSKTRSPVQALVPKRTVHQTLSVCKYNKKSTQADDTDDEFEVNEAFTDERDSKVIKTKVNSLRADLILKAGLGIARNKVENVFYASKIRLNSQKLAKKSEVLNVGDEIDVIRGLSQDNSSHLIISRIIVLAADAREDGFNVILRRYKSLLIENYNGANAYKSSDTVEQN